MAEKKYQVIAIILQEYARSWPFQNLTMTKNQFLFTLT